MFPESTSLLLRELIMPNGTAEATRLGTPASELLELAIAVMDQHFGIPFHYYDLGSLEPIVTGTPNRRSPNQPEWLVRVTRPSTKDGRISVQPISDLLQALVIPLKSGKQPEIVAIGMFAVRQLTGSSDVAEIVRWLGDDAPTDQVRYCHPELLRTMGEGALASILQRRQLQNRETELRQLALQLTRNYEEITLLHQLTREAQVSLGVRTLQESTLSLLIDMMPARQLAYLDLKDGVVLSKGDPVLSSRRCQELVDAIGTQAARNVMVDNHVSTRDWAKAFTELNCLIYVPVLEGREQFGWLLALDSVDGSELGSVEASLMTAVAAILATHQTNVRLFGNIKELFLGVVRALASAIDAKDPYTRGHSDRVAHLARRLGQVMELSEEERNRLYLSGLLHDVGKIGIRDSVLLKPGRLTEEEIVHIQEHPKIGFDILYGVRQLRPVLPGVRSHHENFNGTGYPDRLKGEQIPMMARIVAVADAFDAMSTDRPYRKGMEREKLERIFRDGANVQWDGRVVQAFLTIHDEIQHELQDGRDSVDGGKATTDGRSLPASLLSQVDLDMSKISTFISLGSR